MLILKLSYILSYKSHKCNYRKIQIMIDFDNIEKRYNIKLPKEYKQFYQYAIKEINNKIELHIENDILNIKKFLTVSEINDISEEYYDFFGYDIIPIAETDYGDYICLYYKGNTQNPSIIYWDYELAAESGHSSDGVSVLYKDIFQFILHLKITTNKI